MFQKFKDKLQAGSTGRRSPSPNASNAGWDALLSATRTTLTIAKESVAGLPVPGLEAAIGGLLKDMKANEEAIKSFNAAVVRLNDNVISPLKAAVGKQPDCMDDDLQNRLESLAKYVEQLISDCLLLNPQLISDLEDLVKRADSTQSRERHKRFLSSQDDLGIIQELNRELDRIVMAFTKITAWIDDADAPTIFWLSGMAGVGKSTIAHTVAEQEDRKRRLGASFFFSRDEADRRNSHLVYPTIAFQLAGLDSSLRESVAQALEQDVDIGQAMMQKQFDHLIARPLAKLKGQTRTIVFVLDALDECGPD
ncbi:hypothetical protein FRC00_001460, partial [Tulasnella sp. 408]